MWVKTLVFVGIKRIKKDLIAICSDIVKVDSQKELTQSTFLFFIL